jgi:hypothetical protein
VLTLSVTNDTGDNIRRILIRQAGFDNPLGGDNSVFRPAKQWENVADNLTKAGTGLARVVENLRIAAENKRAIKGFLDNAGSAFFAAGTDMGVVTPSPGSVAGMYLTVRDRLQGSKTFFESAGINIAMEPSDFLRIAENLMLAGREIRLAGIAMKGENENHILVGARRENAADNLVLVGSAIENAADNFIRGGNFGTAATQISTAIARLDNVIFLLSIPAGETDPFIVGPGGARADFIAARGFLVGIRDRLDAAGARLNFAGTKLRKIAFTNFDNALTLRRDTHPAAPTLGYLLAIFSDNVKQAADNLRIPDNENLILAATNLSEAGVALAASGAATFALREFGSLYIDEADDLIQSAGDNLWTGGNVNLRVAASALENAAARFSSAASKIRATAALIRPANWNLVEPAAGDAQFEAENAAFSIAPGASKRFVFLWLAPTITTELSYTIEMWTFNNAFVVTSYRTLTIRVDGKSPGIVTFRVTQAGAAVDNVVGNRLDNGFATITIVASEALSAIGTVRIEDATTGRILLPPIPAAALTTVDNITYTHRFSVGTWDDNTPRVRIVGPWAIDAFGNENTTSPTVRFIVDTRAPVFVVDGLAHYRALPLRVQAGTGIAYRVDNIATRAVTGRVWDNAGPRFGFENTSRTVVRVYINDLPTIPLPGDNFARSVTLSEGVNTVIVKAVDWAGNVRKENAENIFIDIRAPTIAFNTVAGKTWTDGIRIRDNTPKIRLTVLDPGFPTTGLGVARENLAVFLDNDDNIFNVLPTWGRRLDNAIPWVVADGIFENVLGGVAGLPENTYFINVRASDNIMHAGVDNVRASRRFIIDVRKPLVGAGNFLVLDPILGTVDAPRTYRVRTRTIEGALPGAEVGGTVKVYFNGVHQPRYDLPTTTTSWSITVTIPEGVTTRIDVTLTDVAGNESDRVLYGFALVDATAPTVAIIKPAVDITTDLTSLLFTASIEGDAWEAGKDVTVRIDATALPAPVEFTMVLGPQAKLEVNRGIPLLEGVNTISVSAKDGVGNWSAVDTVRVTRTIVPWGTYAIILVIVALILAAIAIFRKK